jgi:hypothetical protein
LKAAASTRRPDPLTLESEDRAAQLARLPVHPGLCATCAHLRLLASARSVFVRCGLAATDPAFPRYPPIPVHRCAGHRPV